MRILGIESSCDETGLAIYCEKEGLIAHSLYSQILAHQPFGGVVPELASRDHIRYIVPLVKEVCQKAKMNLAEIDAIAYTAGPGLMGALLVGACFAKSLSFALNKPAVAVHHLEAHLLVAQMEFPQIQFPFLALLVSGGHTQIIWAKALGDYELLGETIDDAAGEAFDKTAKIMGLPYPGGRALSEMACEKAFQASGLKAFPRPLLDRPGFDFSFSGLKTHALQAWLKSKQDQESKKAIAYAFQMAVVETLFEKTKRALVDTGAKQLVLAGGVAANQLLREKVKQLLCEVFYPSLQYCTDNGAMIAYTGMQYLKEQKVDADAQLEVKARWPLAKVSDPV
ncbi:MAG TPA: tRNA (adenosine(37)-N6)-threonylcarbamoyltransferase complex transferase subunit TsaD [Legionellales bacterium]|nr:tRNA (adenosine(37)-N6)-threonylcarbamoyltransferase complex transferase subunit TsaD [Legionellales bacterium]